MLPTSGATGRQKEALNKRGGEGGVSEHASKKDSRSSSALSMRSAYSPMIQTMLARASGSSSESRLSHSVAMMLSYLHKCDIDLRLSYTKITHVCHAQDQKFCKSCYIAAKVEVSWSLSQIHS